MAGQGIIMELYSYIQISKALMFMNYESQKESHELPSLKKVDAFCIQDNYLILTVVMNKIIGNP